MSERETLPQFGDSCCNRMQPCPWHGYRDPRQNRLYARLYRKFLWWAYPVAVLLAFIGAFIGIGLRNSYLFDAKCRASGGSPAPYGGTSIESCVLWREHRVANNIRDLP